jgi:hypothetical protein
MVFYLLLYVAALVVFAMAALGVTARRINLVALGLAIITLVWVLQTVKQV